MTALRRVLALARPLRRRFAAATLLGAGAIGASVALMATSGYLISAAALRPEILSLTVAIVAVRFFGIARGVLRYGERLVSHDAALRLLGRLRVDFVRRLEPLVPTGLPVARSGDLMSRFVADVEALQHVYLRAVGPPLAALAVTAGSVVAAAVFLPQAGVVLAAGLALAVLGVPALAAAAARRGGRRQARRRAELATEVVELLAAAPELVAYGRAGAQLARVEAADRQLVADGRRDAAVAGFGEGAVTLLAAATPVAVLAVAVPAVSSGALRGVLLAAVVLLATAAFEAARPLPEAAQQLAATEGAAERLLALTDREPPVADPVHPAPAPAGEALRLEGARLRYGRDAPWVLDGVDLELRAGERVALVGPSGAGKTTVAGALVRFRDLDGGRATLDGRDLREYAQDDVRGVVALAGQEAHLFASTIRENVRLARPGAGDDEIEAALRRARLGEWLDTLPEGLDTEVGEAGAFVSGGQRQRIALARAFLSGARFLVLDEPTAHLDAETARAILDDLLEAAGDAGVLVITHDLDGLDRFDRVLSLRDGRVTRPDGVGPRHGTGTTS
jgi:ATP-binding cassette subfamily C protein CydC